MYSLAFFQNCFEEGSNLAILSRNYKVPDDNPYGDDLAELLDRMLTTNCRHRADMTEVILCLSAIYSGRSLPPRKTTVKAKINPGVDDETDAKERVGTYRTDGQGIRDSFRNEKKPVEVRLHISLLQYLYFSIYRIQVLILDSFFFVTIFRRKN